MGKRETISETVDALDHGRPGSYRITALLGCVIGMIALGVGSASVSPQDEWYRSIRKPAWMPPGWLFGVVWTALYAMMGASLALMLDRGWRTAGVRRAVVLFATQLALNLAWSPAFFRFHSPGGAMVVIIALWLMIGWTVAVFWSVRDMAGTLLLPYWAWVTFAVALNAAIWRVN